MHGTKRGGLLPISSFGSRHCRWCRDRNGVVCSIGTPVRTIEDLRARPQACLGRPITTGFLGCFVATEDSLSRQRWLTLCRNRELSIAIRSWVVKAFWCRDRGAALCRDMKMGVKTMDDERAPVCA